MSRSQDLVTALIIKAQRVCEDFNEMLQKTSCLLADSETVQQKFKDCCDIHKEQVLSNLVKYCNGGDHVQQILENAELKRTMEVYKLTIKLIMEKYKSHIERKDMIINQVNLREGYVAMLQEVVDSLESTLQEMTIIMLYSIGLDDNSNENQRTIQQLARDNAEMRRKLQIYTGPNHVSYFEQALPPRSDSSTQSEPPDCFATCFTYNHDAQSSEDSIKAAGKEVEQPTE